MITEDYCGFEVAKLLKEKGFDEECWKYYDNNKNFKSFRIVKCNYDNIPYKDAYIAPTLQMAMKWLREVYKKNINIIYDLQKFQETDGSVEDVEIYEVDIITKNGTFYIDNYNHYESAAEAAIQYCLKNLMNK